MACWAKLIGCSYALYLCGCEFITLSARPGRMGMILPMVPSALSSWISGQYRQFRNVRLLLFVGSRMKNRTVYSPSIFAAVGSESLVRAWAMYHWYLSAELMLCRMINILSREALICLYRVCGFLNVVMSFPVVSVPFALSGVVKVVSWSCNFLGRFVVRVDVLVGASWSGSLGLRVRFRVSAAVALGSMGRSSSFGWLVGFRCVDTFVLVVWFSTLWAS